MRTGALHRSRCCQKQPDNTKTPNSERMQTINQQPSTIRGDESPWVCWRLFLLVSNRQFGAPFRIVDGFVFGWGDVTAVAVETLVVEPVHPPQRR